MSAEQPNQDTQIRTRDGQGIRRQSFRRFLRMAENVDEGCLGSERILGRRADQIDGTHVGNQSEHRRQGVRRRI